LLTLLNLARLILIALYLGAVKWNGLIDWTAKLAESSPEADAHAHIIYTFYYDLPFRLKEKPIFQLHIKLFIS